MVDYSVVLAVFIFRISSNCLESFGIDLLKNIVFCLYEFFIEIQTEPA